MRLLRSDDYTFEEFEGEEIPPYAILSHTWHSTAEEVTYQERRTGTGTEKLGYEKIKRCGAIAMDNGYA